MRIVYLAVSASFQRPLASRSTEAYAGVCSIPRAQPPRPPS